MRRSIAKPDTVNFHTGTESVQSIKSRLHNAFKDAKAAKVINISNQSKKDKSHPGVITTTLFAQSLIRLSKYQMLSKLTLQKCRWSLSSISSFSTTIAHCESLVDLSLSDCWFPFKALFYVSEGLAGRKQPLKSFTITLMHSCYEKWKTEHIRKDLYLVCGIIEKRLIYQRFSLRLSQTGFSLCEKFMLTAGEKMKRLDSILSVVIGMRNKIKPHFAAMNLSKDLQIECY